MQATTKWTLISISVAIAIGLFSLMISFQNELLDNPEYRVRSSNNNIELSWRNGEYFVDSNMYNKMTYGNIASFIGFLQLGLTALFLNKSNKKSDE